MGSQHGNGAERVARPFAYESESERRSPNRPIDEDTTHDSSKLHGPKERDPAKQRRPFTGNSYMNSVSLGSSKCQFVLIFGDHTYQQYGLCMRIPVKFVEPNSPVAIYTSYVFCIMTKFPFFNYLFELMDELDTVMQCFKYSKPLLIQEKDFILQRELKILVDFAARMKRTLVPLYPFLLIHSNRNSSNSSSSSKNSSPTIDMPPCRTPEQSQSSHVASAAYAVLTDIEFCLTDRKLKKIELPFSRSYYQRFYSGHHTGLFNESKKGELNSALKLLQTKQHDFFNITTTIEHRREKEREDAYFILLWALPILLKHLPLDQIVLAIGCAVTEMKIIVKHKDFHVISTVILALVHLLHPLVWCSPMIVILPDSLLDFIGKYSGFHSIFQRN